MVLPRRFLPATSLLSTFEAAARHQSFTAAADELHLTQSAVSRQIRALEIMLGSDLFHREKQKVKLTYAGSSYAREVRDALARISNATLDFRANPIGDSVRIAVPPTLAARWLIPRLHRFLESRPGLSVNLITNLDEFDFHDQNADAVIHFGLSAPPDMEIAYLLPDTVIPLCSPQLRGAYDFTHPEDLLAAPLLHLISRPDAWERWFAAMGVDFPQIHGMLVDQFTLAIEAARAGLGISLLPDFLVDRELASGDLVIAIDRPLLNREGYYLTWPPTLSEYLPLAEFKAWILQEAAKCRSVTGHLQADILEGCRIDSPG